MLKIIHTDSGYAVYNGEDKVATVHVDGPDVEKWGIVWVNPAMKIGDIQWILNALRG